MAPESEAPERGRAFNPYLGPRPFDTADAWRFFGRDRELSDLYSLVAAHRTVLLYAQSGAGKTSLLNAGLIPALERGGPEKRLSPDGIGAPLGFEVLPTSRVHGIPEQRVGGNVNIFVLNATAQWAGDPCESSLDEILANRPRRLDPDGEPLPRVAIFDQFEELFTSYPTRWRERRKFFEQLDRAMAEDPSLRVLFAMREEFIAHLDPYEDLLPEQLRTRRRMQPLRKDAALEAVKKPLQGTGLEFDRGVVERLIVDLLRTPMVAGDPLSALDASAVSGEYVEPVQLQVVCYSLFRDLPPGTSLVTEEHLKTFGDVDHALRDFYQGALSGTADSTGIEQDRIRHWFETKLITEAKTRNLAFRGETTTEGMPNAVVDLLDNLHLIRAEVRSGQRWYELSHDRFIEPILRANDAWRAKSRLEEVQKREEEIRFRQEVIQAKKLRALVWAMGAMVIVAMFASGFAWQQWQSADKASELARKRLDEMAGVLPQNTLVRFDVTATDLGYRDTADRKVYRFQFKPIKDSLAGEDEIALITYVAGHPTLKNRLLRMTGLPRHDYAIYYDGGGCLSQITALIEYANPEKSPTVARFNGCPQGWPFLNK